MHARMHALPSIRRANNNYRPAADAEFCRTYDTASEPDSNSGNITTKRAVNLQFTPNHLNITY